MATVNISLIDITGQALSGVNVVFLPISTPYISSQSVVASGKTTVELDEDGEGSTTLEAGDYEVSFLGIEGNRDQLTIGVPTGNATYALTQLIDQGVTPPNPPGPFEPVLPALPQGLTIPVLTTDGSGVRSWVENGGNPFDQTLNTTDSPQFANLDIETSAMGTANFYDDAGEGYHDFGLQVNNSLGSYGKFGAGYLSLYSQEIGTACEITPGSLTLRDGIVELNITTSGIFANSSTVIGLTSDKISSLSFDPTALATIRASLGAGTTGDALFTSATPGPAVTALCSVVDNSNTTIALADSDSGTVIRCTASTAVQITVPSTLSAGFNALIIQAGAGQITFVAGSGATINSFGALLKTAGQHASASLIRVASATYNLSGNLA